MRNDVKQTINRERALECLERLRAGEANDDGLDDVRVIRAFLYMECISPDHIGTSPQELDDLDEQLAKNKRRAILERLRDVDPCACELVKQLKASLLKSGASLSDEGTSEEELADLVRQSCLAKANRLFLKMHKGPDKVEDGWYRYDDWYTSRVDRLYEVLAEGGLQLSDLNYSGAKQILKNFATRQQSILNCRKYLEEAQEGGRYYVDSWNHFQFARYYGCLTLSDIGVSLEELEKIYKRIFQKRIEMVLAEIRAGLERSSDEFRMLKQALADADIDVDDLDLTVNSKAMVKTILESISEPVEA